MKKEYRLREEEHEALILLKKHFSQYKNLELFDRPDLIDIDNSLGVEVTRAVNPNIEGNISHFHKIIKGKCIDDIPYNSLKKLESVGLEIVSINDDIQSNIEYAEGIVRVFGVEEKRLLHTTLCQKYKKRYQSLNSIDLYIFFRQVCRAALSEKDVSDLKNTAHKCEKVFGKVFRKIMIDFYNVLLIIDLEQDIIEEIKDYGD